MKSEPDASGHFGPYGGRFVSETLIAALDELRSEYPRISATPEFNRELDELLSSYAGRPTPITHAKRMSEDLGGAAVYLNGVEIALSAGWSIADVAAAIDATDAFSATVADGFLKITGLGDIVVTGDGDIPAEIGVPATTYSGAVENTLVIDFSPVVLASDFDDDIITLDDGY